MTFPSTQYWVARRSAGAVLWSAAAALMVASLRFCPHPFLALFIVLALALLAAAARARTPGGRAVAINALAVVAALALFEGYLAWQAAQGDGTRIEGTVTEGFNVPDPVLGYAPRPGRTATARKWHDETLIYDVRYTIDGHGRRVTPGGDPSSSRACVVFFGDSVTFGEGVQDAEAFAYRVGLGGAEPVSAYNFAYSGYGPHQMLALLEQGLEQRGLDCKPTHFVYLAIATHAARVAGLTSWDHHGPRYRLGPDGVPVRDGYFDTRPELLWGATLAEWVWQSVDRFHGWQKLFGRGRAIGPADIELFTAVIKRAASLARAQYPGGAFHVIQWDWWSVPRRSEVAPALRAAGIKVHDSDEFLPDLRSRRAHYLLHARDEHPNAGTHGILAAYVLEEVLEAGGAR